MTELTPTYDAIFERLRVGSVIGLDQTSWPDLEDKTLPPWQMWCFMAPVFVYHRICDDKSAATFKALAGNHEGRSCATRRRRTSRAREARNV